MLTKRLVLAAAALLPVLAPALSHADETTAMNACVKTFLDSDLAKDRKVTVLKSPDSTVRPLSLSGLYKIEVVAKERESGKQIARIVCHANNRGAIIAVNGVRPTTSVMLAANGR